MQERPSSYQLLKHKSLECHHEEPGTLPAHSFANFVRDIITIWGFPLFSNHFCQHFSFLKTASGSKWKILRAFLDDFASRFLEFSLEQEEVTRLYRVFSPMQERVKGGKNVMFSS